MPAPIEPVSLCRNLRTQLIEFVGGRELVDQLIPRAIVEIVFFLLRIGQAALQGGESFGALSGCQRFQLIQRILLLQEAALERFMEGTRRGSESPWEYETIAG